MKHIRNLCLLLLGVVLASGAAVAQTGELRIVEVMYDDTASTDLEWVEVYNTTAGPINISGWYLTDDDTYPALSGEGALVVPNGTTIAAGQYLVLSKDPIPEFAGEVVCASSGSFTLGNSGDNLALYNAATGGTLIDGSLTVQYPDLAPTNAGSTIEKCNPNTAWTNDPAAWHESTNPFAASGRYRLCTPNAANTPCGSDTTPPGLTSITVISPSAVDVLFNEDVSLATAQTVTNYSVNNGVGNPLTAVRDGANNALVHLTFNPLAANSYTLTINGVQDLAGNPCVNLQGGFVLSATNNPGDLRIVEVMYDDTASTDLEWVEVYNTTAGPINISGWYLTDDDTYPTLSGEGALIVPEGTIIAAGQYLVLSRDPIPEFAGEVVCAFSGSFTLGNSGDNLALYNAATGGALIDGSLTVSYPDLAGTNLGNTIEKCNPTSAWTNDPAAWHESTNLFATSGRYRFCTPNAANTPCITDTTPPTLQAVLAVSNAIVDVTFSEEIGQATGETITNYSVNLGVGNPASAVRQPNPGVVRLTFGSPLAPNIYTLTVNNVQDLAGNPILPNSQDTFAVAAPPANLIFTEIMPNPNFEGLADSLGEWFELYNAGPTTVDLAGWMLADNAGADTIEGPAVILPNDYFVFCSNGNPATNGGVPVDYAYRFGTSGWGLSLSNTGDVLTVRNAAGVLVTQLTYTTSFNYSTGRSAQLRDLTWNTAIDTNWCRADTLWTGATNNDRGTPGAATICAPNLPPGFNTLCDIREQDACGIPLLNETRVITEGVVTYVDTCRRNANLQLGGCAVLIYGNAVRYIMQNSTRIMQVGDFVQVDGYIRQFRGLTEIDSMAGMAPVVTFVSAGNALPAPTVLTPGLVDTDVADCLAEVHESKHVRFAGVTFVSGDGINTFAGNTNYLVAAGNDTFQFRVNVCDTLVGLLIPQGPITLDGILSQFDASSCYCSGYQIITGRLTPFTPSVCQGPFAATLYRVTTDTVEVRWQVAANQSCTCYKIYTATTAAAEFPGGYTLLGCVCNRNFFRSYFPLSGPVRFYVVTSSEACP